jgi:hypothetical protein
MWWSSGSGSRKPRLTAVGIRCAEYATPSIQKKLTLILPTSGGRSVGIVCLRTKKPQSIVFISYVTTLSVSRLWWWYDDWYTLVRWYEWIDNWQGNSKYSEMTRSSVTSFTRDPWCLCIRMTMHILVHAGLWIAIVIMFTKYNDSERHTQPPHRNILK